MDWYAELNDHRAVAALRREVGQHLRRHGLGASDFAAADLVVSELVSNVARHAAGPAWVSLSWPGRRPVVTVYDLGPGFSLDELAPPGPLSEGGRGLLIAGALASDLAVAARRAGGSAVSATLPVERAVVEQHDPPRRRLGALPALDEARSAGGFGREAFLRALVAQLANAVESELGPGVAEALVAQVGADIGAQMEDEFRAASGIVGTLSPQQIAQCLVRLKHAIEGNFRVLEVTPERIVLATDSCPFGDPVRRAPGLCRMTSSVFGGIAARNSEGGASVVLEERIALGDPGCRVVVHLGPAPDELVHFGNRYEGRGP